MEKLELGDTDEVEPPGPEARVRTAVTGLALGTTRQPRSAARTTGALCSLRPFLYDNASEASHRHASTQSRISRAQKITKTIHALL